MKTGDRAVSGRGGSVRQDWCSWLADEKAAVFEMYSQQLEAAYGMLSVSLNEAIELHKTGEVTKSYQAVCVTPALCSRLAHPVVALLRALAEHAKHYGTIPNAAPLNAANFAGSREQRSARMSALLGRVLLSQRAQFLHKISTLCDMVEDLQREFCSAAWELAEAASGDARVLWDTLDAGHYDLNTCFRETVVLLKSFLVALPNNQVSSFQKTVQDQMLGSLPNDPTRQHALQHGRFAQIAGE